MIKEKVYVNEMEEGKGIKWRTYPQKKDNGRSLARVYYEKMENGGFLVVRLENFKTTDEIQQKYGNRVLIQYFSKPISMFRQENRLVFKKPLTGEERRLVNFTIGLSEGTIYTKEAFSAAILTAKTCGAHLSAAIKESGDALRCIEI